MKADDVRLCSRRTGVVPVCHGLIMFLVRLADHFFTLPTVSRQASTAKGHW